MGRDALFGLLTEHKPLAKRRKRQIRTTYSCHWLRKYENLIQEREANSANQLWVSDITYWKTNEQVLYVSLITDAYSRKVVGYQVASTLEAIHPLAAFFKWL